TKEKHEEAMVVALSEEKEEGKKWGALLVKFFTTRRTMDLVLHLEFELRIILKGFKSVAALFPGDTAVGKLIQELLIDSPASHNIPKLVLGIQEFWLTLDPLDELHKDVLDIWFKVWGPHAQPLPCDVKHEDFSPVPYDAADLDFETMAHSLQVEGSSLKKKGDAGLICGNKIYSLKELSAAESALAPGLLEVYKNQISYEEKSQDLFKQLAELTLQKQEWELKLKQVNPQDKTQPIVINNNIALVEFQTSLIRRMIRTLDLNEGNNIHKLVTGTAWLACGESAASAPDAKQLFQTLQSYRTQLGESIDQALRGRKSGFFQVSQLLAKQQELDLTRNIENLDESAGITDEINKIQQGLEQLDFKLVRWCKNARLLDNLFNLLKENGIWDCGGSDGSLRSDFLFSFGTLGPDMGNRLHPYGIAHTPEGEMIVAGYDNHRIYRFTDKGIYKSDFGGWGNAPGIMKYPECVQMDSRGCIYVLDEKNKRVQKFSPEEKFVLAFGNRGEPEQRLGTAFSISIDETNRIWVADPEHNRIQIYQPDGSLEKSITSQGEGPENIREPVSVCCLDNGEYLVGDRSDYALKRFDAGEKLLHYLEKGGAVTDELYFLAANNKHGIFASDFWNNQFIHLNHKLELVSVRKVRGKRAGEFGRIAGLSVHKDTLAVSDFENSRVQVFKLPLSSKEAS
ncbi:MAG: NHL repeat-containing protein, partial [Nitrospinaceae bacterium]